MGISSRDGTSLYLVSHEDKGPLPSHPRRGSRARNGSERGGLIAVLRNLLISHSLAPAVAPFGAGVSRDIMQVRTFAAALAASVALIVATPAFADEWVVLTATTTRTVVVANVDTIERVDGVLQADVFVFPQDPGQADMLQARALLTCGRNIMNSQQTIYYDLTTAGGKVTGLSKTREEVSTFDPATGNGTWFGLSSAVYTLLSPLCAGTPGGGERVRGDENSVMMALGGRFVK